MSTVAIDFDHELVARVEQFYYRKPVYWMSDACSSGLRSLMNLLNTVCPRGLCRTLIRSCRIRRLSCRWTGNWIARMGLMAHP